MEAERFGKLGRKLHGSSAKRRIFPVSAPKLLVACIFSADGVGFGKFSAL
jgi:hypothetical protein